MHDRSLQCTIMYLLICKVVGNVLSDTLVSLITVEAQSYGPNSLVGIKVVEYCPPPHLTGGVTEGVPGAVGPPVSQAQPPGQQSATQQGSSLQTAQSKNSKS